jgi:orotate phosphoribosyltransferase
MAPSEDAAGKRARLIEIIRARSYGTGVQIKLASGRVSDFYFNMKPTMLHPEGASLIGDLVVDAISDAPVDMIGGLEMGAVPVATAVSLASFRAGTPKPAFFIRKQAKEHGTQSLVEGLPKGESIAGKTVIVLEDVTTTGGSALKAIDALAAEGATIHSVITLVDRMEGAADAFAAAGYTFTPLLTRADFL